MNKKALIALMSVLSVSLSACGAVKNWEEHLDDYVFEMAYKENFNILQLTDIHWNYNSSTSSSRTYLEKLLEQVKKHLPSGQQIDLIEITGDQFMLANSFQVESFIKFFEKKAEEYGFKYAVIWGNHDRHGLYNPNWLSDQFRKAKNCYYAEPNDNLYGRSNFVINLKDGDTVKWQLANLDSGASFSETAISPFRDYDYIRKDQIEWYKKENEKAGGAPVIAYYHIPQQDNGIAYKTRNTRKNKFFKLEGFANNESEEYYSDFIKVGRENNLKAAFMGHAHNIDWTVDYDGVILGLGVKTGTELYYAHIDANSQDPMMKEGLESIGGSSENFDLIGASLVTIKNETSFDLEHIYFNERPTKDFVRWEKW